MEKDSNMMNRYREKWTREETILAFDLYCKTPFSKISKTNKDIINLAQILGRTPSSVGLKMSNLAHYDPEMIAKDIKGMSNASKLDKEIVEEFYGDWEDLSYQAQEILAAYSHLDIKELNHEQASESIPEGDDIERTIRARVGQDFFRKTVLCAYGNSCCITGIKNQEILIASHIKPWSACDIKTERTNPCNGLSLNAFHDKAFDRGLITLDKKYRIVISPKMKEVEMDNKTQEWFYSYEGQAITLPEKFIPRDTFLEYHNDVVFQR